MLHLVIPGLFASIQVLPETEASRLSALSLLNERGTKNTCEDDGVEALLCRQFGITRQTDWPLAAISFVFDDGRAGSDYWLRADPAHIQIHRDKLILLDELDISADEALALCNSLASHFGDAFAPLPMQPDRWYLRVPDNPRITTTPLSQALGRHIDPLLPQGDGAMHWRKLLNEVQMLLFDHPVNLARESRGLPAINSLWLWGGGTLPAAPDVPNRTVFYGRDFTARAIAKFSCAAVHALPENWHPGIDDASLCLLDQLNRCWRNNDMAGWITALNNIESGWVGPLLNAGIAFSIDDTDGGTSLTWRPLDKWKFWRRAKKAARPEYDLPGLSPGNYTGMDEFGNRY